MKSYFFQKRLLRSCRHQKQEQPEQQKQQQQQQKQNNNNNTNTHLGGGECLPMANTVARGFKPLSWKASAVCPNRVSMIIISSSEIIIVTKIVQMGYP